jgi:hypothetical protein
METGPAAGAGPGGPEPDEDDLVGETEDGRPTVGVDRVLRTGMGGPAAGGHTTADLDAAGSPTPGTSEGRGADDQPGAGADGQT